MCTEIYEIVTMMLASKERGCLVFLDSLLLLRYSKLDSTFVVVGMSVIILFISRVATAPETKTATTTLFTKMKFVFPF